METRRNRFIALNYRINIAYANLILSNSHWNILRIHPDGVISRANNINNDYYHPINYPINTERKLKEIKEPK